jgi:hypothetical protein
LLAESSRGDDKNSGAMTESLDDFWDDLLQFVEERRVIPIVGPDLLVGEVDGRPAALHEVLARRLAEKLRVPLEASARPSLETVARGYLSRGGRREEIYPKLRAMAREISFPPPPALEKLASIEAFDLYVSLSFDAMLVEAIDRARHGGEARTLHLGFCPNRVDDLPAERVALDRPVVYSLFGKLSAAPEFAVTDEDLLEFVTNLQSQVRRPHLLFDELRANHLLVVGAALPDWLVRFFLRVTKDRQLSQHRSELEIMVEGHAPSDEGLVAFFANYSYGTRFFSLDPARFVDELHARWTRSGRRAAQPSATASAAPAAAAEPSTMAPGGVFLSYAREDMEAVLALKGALDRAGIAAWLDKDRLEAGDLYDQKIRRYIKTCGAFIPVISRNSERRLEGYFRREWKLAAERVLGIAEEVPFIMPVVVDDTPEYSASVPEAFLSAQWTRLPGGQASGDFAARVGKIVAEYQRRTLTAA